MGKPEPESRVERQRAARRRRFRKSTAVTVGVVLGAAAIVGSGTGTDTQLLHILYAAKREPIASASARPKASASSGTQSVERSGTPTRPKPSVKPSPTASPSPAATPAPAPPITSLGVSQVLASAQQPAQVGAIFSGSISGGHFCTGSVVDSPSGNIIVTAGHCLTAGTSTTAVFVPDYRNGSAPLGVWQISNVVEASAWTSNQDPDDDVAFALLKPLNGKTIESVTGSYTLDTDAVSSGDVQLTGYPETTDEPISCTGSASGFSASQLQVYCTGYPAGTSGSGWISDYNPTTGTGSLVGVIGGYETGGNTPNVSYSPLFNDNVRVLYDQAVTLAG